MIDARPSPAAGRNPSWRASQDHYLVSMLARSEGRQVSGCAYQSAAERNFLAPPDKTNPLTCGKLSLIEVVLLRARHVGMAPGLPAKLLRQTRGLRLAYSAPEPDTCILEELHRLMLPATKDLPFVKLRADDQPGWHPESYWSVRPTGKRGTDVEFGRAYARKAIAAMKADHNRRAHRSHYSRHHP